MVFHCSHCVVPLHPGCMDPARVRRHRVQVERLSLQSLRYAPPHYEEWRLGRRRHWNRRRPPHLPLLVCRIVKFLNLIMLQLDIVLNTISIRVKNRPHTFAQEPTITRLVHLLRKLFLLLSTFNQTIC